MMLLVPMMLTSLAQAQNVESAANGNYFSRGQGFFIRPELYGAIMVEAGYQLNPYLQVSAGIGTEIGNNGGNIVYATDLVLGARAYASETKWTGFLDYHIGITMMGGYGVPTHRITVGPSYKNFDLGAGIMFATANGTGLGSGVLAPCLTFGYNIRFNRH